MLCNGKNYAENTLISSTRDVHLHETIDYDKINKQEIKRSCKRNGIEEPTSKEIINTLSDVSNSISTPDVNNIGKSMYRKIRKLMPILLK